MKIPTNAETLREHGDICYKAGLVVAGNRIIAYLDNKLGYDYSGLRTEEINKIIEEEREACDNNR